MTVAEDQLYAQVLELGTSTVYEASGQDCLLPERLTPAWPGAAIAGRAYPVRAQPGDNLALHRGLEFVEPGDVLVVDAGQGVYGHWGEVLGIAALERGVRGLVIDGGVRDVARLAQLPFPVFSSSISARGTVKEWPGTMGEALRLGDVVVSRGDLVVADADGIAVIPTDHVEVTLAESRRRAAVESGYFERLRSGELTLDIYGFRAKLSG